MADRMKNEPVRLVTQTPIGNELEITLKRWFQTREFWVNLAAWALTITPIGSVLIGALDLSPWSLAIWSAVIQTVNFGANQYLKNTSKSLVVTKDVMTSERAAASDIERGN